MLNVGLGNVYRIDMKNVKAPETRSELAFENRGGMYKGVQENVLCTPFIALQFFIR